MMSFDKAPRQAENSAVQKYAIRRLEPSISKFLKVLEIDLDRQHRHRLNIQKLIVQEDWRGLNKEQINASRTVQQIKANIREIEKARSQTVEDDLAKFDEKVEAMKEKAVRSIEAFTTDSVISSRLDSTSPSPTSPHPSADVTAQSLPASLGNQQMQLHVVPPDSEAAISWENLQENLQELNEMIHDFAHLVEAQGEGIDRIEDNIDKAHHDVNKGVFSLGKASAYKAAVIPVAGAIIGGVVAGPLGLLAGAKIGGLVGIATGGAAGYMGGRAVKNRQDNITEVEMSNLSERRSASESDADTEPAAPEQKSSFSSMMPWNWSLGGQDEESKRDDT